MQYTKDQEADTAQSDGDFRDDDTQAASRSLPTDGGNNVPAVLVEAAPAQQVGSQVQTPAISLDLWPANEPGQSKPAARAAVQPFPGGGIKLLKLSDLLRFAAEPDMVVIAGFEVGEMGLVLAAPGLGKSTLALGFGVSVASGADYLGFTPNLIGPVMVVTMEDKPSRTARRIIAAAKVMGADRQMVEKNLHVVKCEAPSLLFRRGADGLGVEMTQKAIELMGKVKRIGVRLLIIEPLVETHNASENENGSMHAVMAGFRLFATEGECAVLVAHHVSRPEEKASAASSRGAGSIHAASRFSLVLNELDKATAKQFKAAGIESGDLLQLEIGKFNNGAKGKPMILRRRTVAVGPFSAPVLELFKPEGDAESEE